MKILVPYDSKQCSTMKKTMVSSTIAMFPTFLSARILPKEDKDQLVKDFEEFKQWLWDNYRQDDYFWKTPVEKENEQVSQAKEEAGNNTITEQLGIQDEIGTIPTQQCGDDMACIISHWKEFAPDQRLDGETWEENIRKALRTKFDR